MGKNPVWCFMIFCACLAPASGQADGMNFRDLKELDPETIRAIGQVGASKAVGIERGLPPIPPARSNSVRAVSAIEIDHGTILDFIRPSSTQTLGPKQFALPLAGETIEFLIVDVVWDTDFQDHHLAAVSLSEPRDYIRITIPASGESLVATAHVADETYQIVPYKSESVQVVFRIDDQDSPVSRLASTPVSFDTERRERRHVQLAEIADLRPQEFITAKDGWLSHIIGGDLGSIDLSGLGRIDDAADRTQLASRIENFIMRNRAVIGVESIGEIRVTRVSPGSGRTVIAIQQFVNGLRVEGMFDFRVDPDTGKVIAMGGTLVEESMVDTDTSGWYSKEEAVKLAKAEVEHLRPGSGGLELIEEELLYRWAIDDENHPFWQLVIRTNRAEPFSVVVNAITGEATANLAIFY